MTVKILRKIWQSKQLDGTFQVAVLENILLHMELLVMASQRRKNFQRFYHITQVLTGIELS